jgi:hypothetical protein
VCLGIGAATAFATAGIAAYFGTDPVAVLVGVAVGMSVSLLSAGIYDLILRRRRERNGFIPPPRRGD